MWKGDRGSGMRTFEDLVHACLQAGGETRLLYVYVKMVEAPDSRALQELFPGEDVAGIEALSAIVFDAHEPVKPGLVFADMVEKADGYCADWDVVFVMTSRNADGSPVSDEQATENLADMRARIMAGKFSGNAPIFDRTGALKGIDRAVAVRLDEAGAKVN